MLAADPLEAFIHALYSQVFTRLIPAIILTAVAGGLFRWALTRLTTAAVRKVRRRMVRPEHGALRAMTVGQTFMPDAPHCPACNRVMVERMARRGANRGQSFWGCSGYPGCKGTRQV